MNSNIISANFWRLNAIKCFELKKKSLKSIHNFITNEDISEDPGCVVEVLAERGQHRPKLLDGQDSY